MQAGRYGSGAMATDELAEAAYLLTHGGLVGFPTETVYGLGADATNAVAVRRIFAAKGRPPGHPLIVHLASVDALANWAQSPSEVALRLAAAFWPGPLTLVVHRGTGLAAEVTGGRSTVGLRVPDHPVALALLARAGVPVAAPSANRFGRVSPTTAADVRAELGDAVDLVVDGGPCEVGLESTIVELVDGPPMLLRAGGIPAEAIEAVLGRSLVRVASGPSRASGMMVSHYAPKAAVEMVSADGLARRAAQLISAGRRVAVVCLAVPPAGVLVLARPQNNTDYARCLYRSLRAADGEECDVVLLERPSAEGLGAAVLDRLNKAAAPRPE